MPEIKVGRYTQPVIHLIALDGRNRVLKNRSLRRGLSYAIDRKTILEETVLRPPRPTPRTPWPTGPFPKGSYADAPGVKPLGYNSGPGHDADRRGPQGAGRPPIELKLEYPAIPEAQAVVSRASLEAIRDVGLASGLKIEAVEVPESQLETELRADARSTWPIACSRATSPSSRRGPCSARATTPRPRPTPWLGRQHPDPPAPAPARTRRRARPRPGAWPSRSTASRATSCRCCRSGRWSTTTPGGPGFKGPGEAADQLYQGIESWEITPVDRQGPVDDQMSLEPFSPASPTIHTRAVSARLANAHELCPSPPYPPLQGGKEGRSPSPFPPLRRGGPRPKAGGRGWAWPDRAAR